MKSFPPLHVTLGADNVALVVHVTPEQNAELQRALTNAIDETDISPTVRLCEVLAQAVGDQIPDAKICVQATYPVAETKPLAAPSDWVAIDPKNPVAGVPINTAVWVHLIQHEDRHHISQAMLKPVKGTLLWFEILSHSPFYYDGDGWSTEPDDTDEEPANWFPDFSLEHWMPLPSPPKPPTP